MSIVLSFQDLQELSLLHRAVSLGWGFFRWWCFDTILNGVKLHQGGEVRFNGGFDLVVVKCCNPLALRGTSDPERSAWACCTERRECLQSRVCRGCGGAAWDSWWGVLGTWWLKS